MKYYCAKIANVIRKEFSFKESFRDKNMEIARKYWEQIRFVYSLHLRRLHGMSDGVITTAHNKIHGALTLEYNRTALTYLQERITDLHVFVISNQPEWTRNNSNLSHSTHLAGGEDGLTGI